LHQIGIDIVLPLVAIMLVGYLAGYFRLLPTGSSKAFSRFVFLIAMPPFIFISLADIPVSDFFNWQYLAVLGGGMLLVYGISFSVARTIFPDSLSAHGLHALTAMFSSTAYIGLPIILVVFGDTGLVPGIIGAVITVAVFMPMTIVLAELDKGRSSHNALRASLAAVARNPLLIATVTGLLASGLDISIPNAVTSFCEILGGAFIPSALFAAGLFISGSSIKGGAREVSWLIVAKLVLHPIITWWFAYHIFEVDRIWAAIAVFQAALPSGVPVFVLAQHYGVFENRSNAVIVLSTLISLLTLPVLLLFIV